MTDCNYFIKYIEYHQYIICALFFISIMNTFNNPFGGT